MNKIRLSASDFVIDGLNIWFSPLEIPYLINANLETGEINKHLYISASHGGFTGFFEKIEHVDDSIIGVPYWSEQYFKYNINQNSFEYVTTPKELHDVMGVGYYATGLCEGFMYSFVRFFQNNTEDNGKMFIYNTKSNALFTERLPEIDKLDGHPYDALIRRDVVQHGTKLFLISGVSNHIYIFDMKTKNIETVSLLDKNTRFTCIELADENSMEFVLADNTNRITVWNMKDDSVETIDIDVNGFETANHEQKRRSGEQFSFAKKCGDNVYFFPYFSNMIIKYDVKNKSIMPAFEDALCCCNVENYIELDKSFFGQFSEPHVIDEVIYVWNIWEKTLLALDTNRGSVDRISVDIALNTEESANLYKDCVGDDTIVSEGSNVVTNVSFFVDSILS